MFILIKDTRVSDYRGNEITLKWGNLNTMEGGGFQITLYLITMVIFEKIKLDLIIFYFFNIKALQVSL